MNEVCDMKFSGGNLDPTVRRYPASLQLPMHSHTQGRLCFVIRGNFQETIGPRNYERQRGAVLFRPAGLNHSEQFGRNESTCGLLTPTSKWLELTDEFGFLQQNDRTAVGGAALRLVETFEHEWSIGDSFSGLSLQSVLWESIALLGWSNGAIKPSVTTWASRALEYLHAHSEGSPTLSQVALALGVHRGHLARVFRAAYGETLGATLRRIRAQRAVALIRGTQVSLADIATRCGFSHQAHMTRVFKSLFGATPGRFRG